MGFTAVAPVDFLSVLIFLQQAPFEKPDAFHALEFD